MAESLMVFVRTMAEATQRRISPLSKVDPWDWVAAGYLEVTAPKLALYAEEAVKLAALQPHHRVLDVAAGPGTVACMIASTVAEVVAVDFSPAMVTLCRQQVAELGLDNVSVIEGDGQQLALDDTQFHRAFSMFGLMFFPDRAAGFAELYRLLLPGGMAFVTSWAPLSESSLMTAMIEALRVADPSIPPPTADIASLENPDLFYQEMSAAGFGNVVVQRVYKDWGFADFDEFFDRMVRGSAPLEVMKRAVPEAEWARRLEVIRVHLFDKLGSHPTGLGSTAWLARGTK